MATNAPAGTWGKTLEGYKAFYPNRLHPISGAFETNRLAVREKCGLMHYQFEAIHPFLDGNGRIGCLLITLLLCERNALPGPFLYLSAFFEATRRDYYERLNAVRSLPSLYEVAVLTVQNWIPRSGTSPTLVLLIGFMKFR